MDGAVRTGMISRLRSAPILFITCSTRIMHVATEVRAMTDSWIDDFGMVQCPRCEQVFPVDAQLAGTLPVHTHARVPLRIACPNCANICRVEHDAMAIGLH